MPSKFHRPWAGPYRVQRVLSEATCVVARPDIHNAVSFAVHFNKLKHYLCDRPSSSTVIQHSNADDNRVLPNVPAVDTTLEVPPGGGEARLVDNSENTPVDGLHANWAAM